MCHFDGHLTSSMRKFVTNVLLGTMPFWVLASAYGWRMAKIVIVPKRTLVTNFLMELVAPFGPLSAQKWPAAVLGATGRRGAKRNGGLSCSLLRCRQVGCFEKWRTSEG